MFTLLSEKASSRSRSVARKDGGVSQVTVAPPEAASVAYDAAEETLAVRASVRGAVEVRDPQLRVI